MGDKAVSTADMYLAALLLAKDFSLINIDRSDPKHIHFEFGADSDDPLLGAGSADTVIRSYTNGDSVVMASRFVEALRKIKSLIHAG